MRTGATAGHRGHYHEAVCYSSDEELLGVAVPFLLGGLEAGEPTVVSLGERNAGLLREKLGDLDGIEYRPGGAVYARPAVAIRSYRDLLAGFVAEGAGQIRIIGEIPPAGLGATWDWWARYEAAVNVAYHEFPLWSMCAYDTRSTPAHVLEDVARTHPRSAEPDGSHRPSSDYVGAAGFLSAPRVVEPDPVEATPPLVDLTPTVPEVALECMMCGRDLRPFRAALANGVAEPSRTGTLGR